MEIEELFDINFAKKILHSGEFDHWRMAIYMYNSQIDQNDIHRIFYDMVLVHEFSHYIQFTTTTFGLLYRIFWEDLLLQFLNDCNKFSIDSSDKILVRPIIHAKDNNYEIFNKTIKKYRSMWIKLNAINGFFNDEKTADEDNKLFQRIKFNVNGKNYEIFPGAKLIIEALSTDIHNEWFNGKTRDGLGEKIIDLIVNPNNEYYIGYYMLRWFFGSIANDYLKLKSDDDFRKILDWSLMIPLDFSKDLNLLKENLVRKSLNPWHRLTQLIVLSHKYNGGVLPDDFDSFLSDKVGIEWYSEQKIINSTLSYLSSQDCSLSKYFSNIFIKAFNLRKKNPNSYIHPIIFNSNVFFTDEIIRTIGYPSIILKPNNRFIPSKSLNEQENNFIIKYLIACDIFEGIVLGDKKSCPFYFECDERISICKVDCFSSGKRNCLLAKLFEEITHIPFSQIALKL